MSIFTWLQTFKPLDGQAITKDAVRLARAFSKGQMHATTDASVAYEIALAQFQEVPHALAFGSGRAALWAILSAFQLPPQAKVLTPAFTCVAVPQAIQLAGAIPIYYDIEPDTYGPDAKDLEKKLSENPDVRVVIIHHLFGLVARDYELLIKIAKAHNCLVVEDMAQSFGARVNDMRIGYLSDAAFTSTEQSKILCTMRGGVAFLPHSEYFKKLKQQQELLPQIGEGQLKYQWLSLVAYHSIQKGAQSLGQHKMNLARHHKALSQPAEVEKAPIGEPDFVQLDPSFALIGLSQLKGLDALANRKRDRWPKMEAFLKEKGWATPFVRPDSQPVWLRVPFLPTHKIESRKELEAAGFQVGEWFVSTVHPLTITTENCPVAQSLAGKLLNIGLN